MDNNPSRKIEFTKDEFQGFAQCLRQLCVVGVTMHRFGQGNLTLTKEEFVGALKVKDPQLAQLAGNWFDSMAAMKSHLDGKVADQPMPSFDLNPGGVVL